MSAANAYYDREAGIVYFQVRPPRGPVYSDERNWGLIDREDDEEGAICGIEIWEPEEMFPPDLLDALPAPRPDP